MIERNFNSVPKKTNDSIIVMELNGGLGNQMFQYAFGRALSLKRDANYYINLNTLKNGVTTKYFTARPFELGIFDIKSKVAHENEIDKFYSRKFLSRIFTERKSKNIIFKERSFNYNFETQNIKGNIYLKGYWQSEKYFSDYRNSIRNDFIFISDKNKLTHQIANDISACNAISIHIRRGDYVTSPSSNEVHGTLPLEYYTAAMEIVQNKISNPVYFVFSDDCEWIKERLVKNKTNMVVVNHNTGKESWQDMYLMSLCNHHIIANSSFSWWGAWLNNMPDKIVIAPKNWFANEDLNNQTSDIIPNSWIKL